MSPEGFVAVAPEGPGDASAAAEDVGGEGDVRHLDPLEQQGRTALAADLPANRADFLIGVDLDLDVGQLARLPKVVQEGAQVPISHLRLLLTESSW